MIAIIFALTCQDDTLIYARKYDSASLDPAEAEYGEDFKVIAQIFEPLIGYAEDSTELVPLLAKSWEASKDGLTWTIILRDGIRFHDGEKLDAAIVAASYRRLLKDAKSAPYRELYSFVDKVTGEGMTVKFALKEPRSSLPALLAIPAAAIVSMKTGKPAGTGPFKLTEWQPNEKIVLERFDEYWGFEPAFRRQVFLAIQDVRVAIGKVVKGEVHIVDFVGLSDVRWLASEPGLRVVSAPSTNVAYLGFNLKKPPYDDPEFRAAVSLALDREGLNRAAYHGLGEPARNLVPPAIWRNAGELAPFESDLERARERLAKVKLPKDFVAEIWYPSFARPYMPEPESAVEYIRGRLAQLGLGVRVRGVDKTYTHQLSKGEHSMYLLGWMGDYAGADAYLEILLDPELTHSGFQSPEFARLLKDARLDVLDSKANQRFLGASQILRREIPVLPLMHVPSLYAVSDRIDWSPHPMSLRLDRAGIRKP